MAAFPPLTRGSPLPWLGGLLSALFAALLAEIAAAAAPPPAAAGPATAFGFAQVAQRAQALAASAYQPPGDVVPAALKQLNHGEYSRIRQRPERALWGGAGTAFEVSFFPPGLHYLQPVKINEIHRGGVRELRFDPADFDFAAAGVAADRLDGAKGLGYAGLRIHFTVGGERREALVFHGASLFRSPGDEGRYGAWARGLAIDTALASGEEFPRFVEFWLERPTPAARHLVVYALLDSPRLTGAYRFVVEPGEDGVVQQVRARLYARSEVGKLALAPLASMFFSGENAAARAGDYRPEIHDSDGLSIKAANGEWIWRPLINPRRLLVTAFALRDPAGFGLMQRDRSFASYQDPEQRREQRPSVWVEPDAGWGSGRVELVQLPTPDEFNNNIVAYWVPEAAPVPGRGYDFGYRVSWQTGAAPRPLQAWVAQTRSGSERADSPPDEVALRIDFVDPLAAVQPAGVPVRAVVWADANGELLEARLAANRAIDGWRATLRLRRRDAAKPVELRLHLAGREGAEGAERQRSETWSYVLPPQ